MKKVLLVISIFLTVTISLAAQQDIQDQIDTESSSAFAIPSSVDFGSSQESDDELFGGVQESYSDDDLFGSDDDLFGSDDDLFGSEDDLFSDDGIEEITDTTAKDNLSKGILFEAGAVKIGGSLKAGLNTNTILYNPDQTDFGQNLKDTTLSPNLSAMLTVDARPTETLRIYTKFGMGYPFVSKAVLNLTAEDMAMLQKLAPLLDSLGKNNNGILGQLGKGTRAPGAGDQPGAGAGGQPGGGTGDQGLPTLTPEELQNLQNILGPILNNQGQSGGQPGQDHNNKNPGDKNNNENEQDKKGQNITDLANKISIKDWFNLKELFTDFSIKDRAFFRFGLHTVSWGTGYFFSPVSDMINTSQIDPENPTEQVNGALNLRTQVVFPGSQNCLWLYLIPSTDFSSEITAQSYARDTGLAGKFDLVLGGWELGFGTFWKYENAPKLMLTASGSIKKLSLFGEAVYQYGALKEWNESKEWKAKSNIFQITLGGFYNWSKPGIMLALQYYFDGNKVDFMNRIYTNGHNIALMANFSKFGSLEKLSASLFFIANINRAGLTEDEKTIFNAMAENGSSAVPAFPCLMINANFAYRPVDDVSLSFGPGIVFTDYNKKPTVSLKFGVTLGGGKF